MILGEWDGTEKEMTKRNGDFNNNSVISILIKCILYFNKYVYMLHTKCSSQV